ncbi:hypothetical protein OBBRIDRAFT_230409 [Obba rivulosa]|uniref:F-box domain-containing protein n=1 Tax=Obba rivulosa TaxID=1052685 RepID=A0A8E2J746_9APHY|nr:hypothetical protein OBBRIDRAFT_230409 [Obba rivulosa]
MTSTYQSSGGQGETMCSKPDCVSVCRVGAPIEHLPDEILHEIMHLVMVSPCYLESKSPWNWLAVSQVCRYWRQLSLASPQLWRHIDINICWIPILLRQVLERSQNMSLQLHFKGPIWRDDIETLAWMAAQQSSRIEDLVIEDFHSTHAKMIIDNFASNPAPLLRRLKLTTVFDGTSHIRIFDYEMPALRSIYLYGLTMPWCSYRNMTELEIHRQPSLTASLLMATLHLSPELRLLALTLNGPLVRDIGPASPDFRRTPIELPHLQDLFLASSVHEDVYYILS